MTSLLEVERLSVAYGKVLAVRDVSLRVAAGTIVTVIGPNGAGKTTLLSVIAGLLPLRGGELRWVTDDRAGDCGGDFDLRTTPTDARARAGMVLIPERRGIFGQLSVKENLEIFAGAANDQEPAFNAFPVLADRLSQRAGSLSGGEQQMLAMSRALLQHPRLLLLDEISLGLAPRVTRRLFDVVAELARTGTTVVLVEQYLSDALRLAEIVYVLARGDVVFAGEPGELAGRALPGYVTSGPSS